MKANIATDTILSTVLAEVGRQIIAADLDTLAIRLSNTNQLALNQCQIRGIIGGAEFTLASASGDFTAPVFPLLRASGNLAALAAGASGYAMLDTRFVSEVRVFAAAIANVAATAILTAAGQPANTNTVTIGSVTYTFQTVLVNAPNNVLIGATASISLDNLIAAINAGAGAGTLYGTGTVANPHVSALAGAGDTIDVTAVVAGSAANAVALAETSANLSWNNATLTGGLGPTTLTVGFNG